MATVSREKGEFLIRLSGYELSLIRLSLMNTRDEDRYAQYETDRLIRELRGFIEQDLVTVEEQAS